MTNRKQRRTVVSDKLTKAASEPPSTEIDFLVTQFNQGRLVEAEVLALEMTIRYPVFGFGWKVLGVLLKLQRRFEESLEPMQKAAAMSPFDPQAHTNLGLTLKELGRLEEAESCYLHAIKIKPDYAEAHSTLGNIRKDLGRLVEAEACYRSALAIAPQYPDALCNLGATLHDLGRIIEAESCYRKALVLKPDYATAYYNLGNALREIGAFRDAEACYLNALDIDPYLAEAHNNLGNVFKELDLLDKAELCYRRSLEINPDLAVAYSNILFSFNYRSNHDQLQQVKEAFRYGEIVARKVKQRFSSWKCELHPKKLRVGMVSGDFHNHPVGFFLEGVLEQINSSCIELIAYTTDLREDELTDRIKPYFSEWKSLVGLRDEVASHLIHADGVHILFDLSGHTANNRLPVFAWKPAPVQASWLGYLATTGMAEIDYLLGDPYATPPEIDWQFSEKILRLPDVWGCFTPPVALLEVSRLPALSTGYITFGCFNNLAKMNDEVVALWAQILKQVPNSRLFLKTKQLNEITVRKTTQQRFSAFGIEHDRLILEGSSPRAELLAAYKRVDIGLDPFPYTGGTTNFEVLWMGIPVITCKGNSFISRGGQSVVYNSGMPDWIAEDSDDYVKIAVMHSANIERLAALRSGLREKVLNSPLFDSVRFARNFETALSDMWEEWKKSQSK